jgi:hypothetical protein
MQRRGEQQQGRNNKPRDSTRFGDTDAHPSLHQQQRVMQG